MRAPAATVLALCALGLCAQGASAEAPLISAVGFSHVGTTSATLEAVVDPGGKANTKYHFELGPSDCSALPDPCSSTAIEKVKQGEAPESISVVLEGLAPKSTYHFLVVAQNNDGTAKSTDRTFTTHVIPFEGLPDGRAYEQASPLDKNAVDARGTMEWTKASPSGDAVTFASTSGMPGGEGGQVLPAYLSRRIGNSWSTQGLQPAAGLSGSEAFISGWLPDFSATFSWAKEHAGVGDATFLERSSEGGALGTLVPYGDGLALFGIPRFAGASADGSAVFFEDKSNLTSVPESLKEKPNLYVWDKGSGELSLAGVMNDEKPPAQGAFAGPYAWNAGSGPAALSQGGASVTQGGAETPYYLQDEHAITPEGSVYFTAAGSGQLYLRQNPTAKQGCGDPALACTLHVSASHRTPPDPLGERPAAFMQASTDGKAALFTSPEELTDDANTGPDQLPPAIARAGIDGKEAKPDFLPATHANAVALDATHIYWADAKDGTIGRAGLEGESPEPEFIKGLGEPRGIAVDAEHIYWTEPGELSESGKPQPGKGSIGRAGIDGKGVEPAFIPGEVEVKPGVKEKIVTNPKGIDVDATHVYWVNAGDPEHSGDFGNVGRAGIDGKEAQAEFLEIANGDVAVNGTKIYFSRSTGKEGGVRWANLNGSGTELLLTVPGAKEAPALALDASHLYWANPTTGQIGRSGLDGSGPEQNFIEGAGKPKGLAVNASHVYWAANQDVLPHPGNDLYRYQAEAGGAGKLTDLAPDGADVNGAQVLGVLGASEDTSSVYFAANGVPAGVANSPNGRGESAAAGDCGGSSTTILNFSGECNLYLAREGEPLTFIARLDTNGGGSDAVNWVAHGLAGQLDKTARVSANGQTLLFRSQRRLSAYDNEGAPELYRYLAGDAAPSCVSCNPSGERPGPLPKGISLTSLVPSTPTSPLSRTLSSDGKRAFFESTDALVASDTNGEAGCPDAGSGSFSFPICQDVYEWEAQGTGSCEEDVQGGGCLYLLSTGKSPEASFFGDASENGDNAFVITSSQGLVRQDQDQLYDVYDARVGGGIAAQNEVPPPPCEEEACKGPVRQPPAAESPGSASFSGPPNPKPSRKGAHKKKRHHKKAKKHHGKTNGQGKGGRR